MIDLHLHTTASDGTLTPSELVLQARAAGLSIISITDHDTTAGSDAAVAVARDAGIRLVPGSRSAPSPRGATCTCSATSSTPRRRRCGRSWIASATIGSGASPRWAIGCRARLPDRRRADPRGRGAGQSVGRPQIAEALIAAGHVQTRDEAFERFLAFGGAAYVPRTGTSPEDVVAIVHDAGGMASLAHPGVSARDQLIAPLAAAGLDAIEAVHSDHDAATEARYRALAADLGLLVTGGSDFHGPSRASRVAGWAP